MQAFIAQIFQVHIFTQSQPLRPHFFSITSYKEVENYNVQMNDDLIDSYFNVVYMYLVQRDYCDSVSLCMQHILCCCQAKKKLVTLVLLVKLQADARVLFTQ